MYEDRLVRQRNGDERDLVQEQGWTCVDKFQRCDERWKQKVEDLMIEKNVGEQKGEEVAAVEQNVAKSSNNEGRKTVMPLSPLLHRATYTSSS